MGNLSSILIFARQVEAHQVNNRFLVTYEPAPRLMKHVLDDKPICDVFKGIPILQFYTYLNTFITKMIFNVLTL